MSFPRSSVRTRSHTLLIRSFTHRTAIHWMCPWAMPCARAVFSTTWSPDAQAGKELCKHAFGCRKWSKNGMEKMLWKPERESVKVTFQECLVEQTGFCQAEKKEGSRTHRERHGSSLGCERAEGTGKWVILHVAEKRGASSDVMAEGPERWSSVCSLWSSMGAV